jgi:hypothetical protein
MQLPDDYQESPRLPPEELCVAKTFSLKRKTIAAIRSRAAHLGLSLSSYLSALIHNDLVRGFDAPLLLEPSPAPQPHKGVVVQGFERED